MAELITLLDDVADVSPLSLAATGDVINDLRVNGQQLVQLAGGLRAANSRPINRGNIVNRITVGVTHEPAASPAEAKQDSIALIAALTAKVSTATILQLQFGTVVIRLTDAAVENYDIYARGTTVFASYTFAGGALSVVP